MDKLFGIVPLVYAQLNCTIGFKTRAPGAWCSGMQNMINICIAIKIYSLKQGG